MERIATGLMRLAAACLLVGIGTLAGCQADGVDTEVVISQLDAPDPVVRTEAIHYWLDGDSSTPSRFAKHRELWSAIDERSGDFQPETMRDMYRHLTDRPSSPAYQVSALMPLTYQRMLRTALADHARDETELRKIMGMIVPSKDGPVSRDGRHGLLWEVASDAERTAIWETHQAVFEALANDREAINGDWYFYDAYVVMGADSAELLDMLLDAESPAVRQRAWLLWGLMDMPSDRRPRGRDLVPDDVRICMVAAEILASEEPENRILGMRSSAHISTEHVAMLDEFKLFPRELDGSIDFQRIPKGGKFEDFRVLLVQVDYAAGMAKHRREYLVGISEHRQVSRDIR